MTETRKKSPYMELVYLALGEILVIGILAGIFAALGKFHWNVITGGLIGAAVGIINQFLLTAMAGRAFDKAAEDRGTGEMSEEEVKEFTKKHESSVKTAITVSFILRMALLVGLLILAFLLPGVFNPIAVVVALVSVQLFIIVISLLKKKKKK